MWYVDVKDSYVLSMIPSQPLGRTSGIVLLMHHSNPNVMRHQALIVYLLNQMLKDLFGLLQTLFLFHPKVFYFILF